MSGITELIDARIERALAKRRPHFRAKIGQVRADVAVQLVQLGGLAGEGLADHELFQHYGLTTNPPDGTQAIVAPLGGKTAHCVVIATEHGTYRLKSLKRGEVALYTDEGDSIVMKRGRIVEVTTATYRVNASEAIELNSPTITGNATGKVQLNTPTVNASGEAHVASQIVGTGGMSISGTLPGGGAAKIEGDLDTTASIKNKGKEIGSTHTHSNVQSGLGTSGSVT